MNLRDELKKDIRALKRDVNQDVRGIVPGRGRAVVPIGINVLSGKQVSMPIEDPEQKGDALSSTHSYIIGGSGTGKTTVLEPIIQGIIRNGNGVIVMDGKGNDLYSRIRDFCAAYGYEDRTILIDPNEPEWSVGINYLELLGDTRPELLAEWVLDALMKFFGEDQEYKPWLQEWGKAALPPLINAGMTLVELFEFVSIQRPAFRNAVLSELHDTFRKNQWAALKSYKPNEQASMLGALRTRATEFNASPILKAMFGQQKTTIDWLKVMNEGGIVLANLGETTKVPGFTGDLIGAAILNQIRMVAPLRTHKKSFFFAVDEFQKFVTQDFADALDLMRSFGLSFLFAHQHRAQLQEKAPQMIRSIDANCRNKMAFAISREDAEHMALELFSGLIHKGAEEIKQEIWQTKLRPIKTHEDIVTDSGASSTSNSSSDYYSEAEAARPAELFTNQLFPTDMVVMNTTGGGGASVSGSGMTTGQSVTRAPWYDYEEYQELSSRQFYSLEEVKERFISWIKAQDDRHAQWRFKNKAPLPIRTVDVDPVIVVDGILDRFKDISRRRYSRPTSEVFEEIDKRVAQYIETSKVKQPTPLRIRSEIEDDWE